MSNLLRLCKAEVSDSTPPVLTNRAVFRIAAAGIVEIHRALVKPPDSTPRIPPTKC